MKALYRKYRPRSLDEVVGQKQVTEALANSLAQGKIFHAYLFTGPRGTGKTSVARIFAHEINNFQYEIEDDYVDIVEIDGASNRGIDSIRELREKALIAPTSGKYKVYIIDEVHMLTKEAFNALLKTLEEPPEHVIFIMATTDAHKVPVTIVSRAQNYSFKLADHTTMFDLLRDIADKENIKIDDQALDIVVKRGGGSFRDSLSLLDQISTLSDELISKEMVESAMGLPEDKVIEEILSEYAQNNFVAITGLLKDLFASGIKPEIIVEEMLRQIIENPQTKLLPLAGKLSEIRAPFIEAKLLVALWNGAPIPAPVRTAPATPTASTLHTKSAAQATPKAPATSTAQHAAPITGDFDWKGFLEKVKEVNDAVYSQLLKTRHKLKDGVLEIYPEKNIVKSILSRDKNKQILVDKAGVRVNIHEVIEDRPKDETLAKISDIMGGEVKNDGGENPFG